MAGVALPLINVLAGIGGIGAGVGFGIEEQKKMKKLSHKTADLSKAAADAGNLYDHTYYLVAVNVDRVKKAIDKLPSDFIEKVQDDINDLTKGTDATKAITLLGQILGYTGAGIGALSGIIKLVRKIRASREEAGEPEPTPENDPENPYEGQPIEAPPSEPSETSLPATNTANRLLTGLDVAGAVLSVGGLAATIGLGIWTIVELDKAISEVEKKMGDVDKFTKGMTDVLDPLVKDAGLPPKSYKQLQTMAGTWKQVSEHYEGYSKVLSFAIESYILKKSFEDVKKLVQSKQDEGEKPFPEDAYPLAKTLADDLIVKFKAGLTDKEIVKFFATENPKIGYRFVFDEFFIGTVRMMAGH